MLISHSIHIVCYICKQFTDFHFKNMYFLAYSDSLFILIFVVHDTLSQNKDEGALINKHKPFFAFPFHLTPNLF